MLENSKIHDVCLPPELGYKAFADRLKHGELHYREQEGNYYVRIYKKDGLMVRLKKDNGWT